ncbi:MAG: 1,2-phenylacetyl-CoA epoxidase subunit PaaD [Saprospiraceae bacterium]
MNPVQNKDIQDLLREVTDPEIPVLSIMDMGVVRDIEPNGKDLLIKITPTYSGCPAMDTIATDIKLKMDAAGYNTTVKLILSPAWTTDWITERGRAELEKYGIAAPLDETSDKHALIDGKRIVKCTNCSSTNTKMVSQFGSTACKALFQCEDCLEPFDYFKCLK